MARYSVTLEHQGGADYLGWVHELPGCHAYGATREAVLANLPAAISQFRGRLPGPGEEVQEDQVELEIVQEMATTEKTAEGGTEVFLTWDQEPLAHDDWMRIEGWLQYSRQELLGTVEQIQEDQLEIAARDGARTIARQLRHIAAVEFMYALWTFDLGTKQEIRALLEWTRQMAVMRMRALAERQDQRLTYAEWAGSEHREPWSARKAARRLVYHELWHLRSIRRLLQGLRGREASGAP